MTRLRAILEDEGPRWGKPSADSGIDAGCVDRGQMGGVGAKLRASALGRGSGRRPRARAGLRVRGCAGRLAPRDGAARAPRARRPSEAGSVDRAFAAHGDAFIPTKLRNAEVQ